MEDIKSTLYRLLAKTTNLQPKYKFRSFAEFVNGKEQPPSFECQVVVFGFDYVGESGPCKSKKEAQTVAATKLVEWLVENGHYEAADFPQLQPNQNCEENPENGGGGGLAAEPPLEDIKMSLHSVLGKAKRALPAYKYHCKSDGRQYFECDCTVDGFDYVAHSGRAQTKKASQTAAAEAMARWLVEKGHFDMDQFPWLIWADKKRMEEEEEWAENVHGLE